MRRSTLVHTGRTTPRKAPIPAPKTSKAPFFIRLSASTMIKANPPVIAKARRIKDAKIGSTSEKTRRNMYPK